MSRTVVRAVSLLALAFSKRGRKGAFRTACLQNSVHILNITTSTKGSRPRLSLLLSEAQ
jgi:hypothetical protein